MASIDTTEFDLLLRELSKDIEKQFDRIECLTAGTRIRICFWISCYFYIKNNIGTHFSAAKYSIDYDIFEDLK